MIWKITAAVGVQHSAFTDEQIGKVCFSGNSPTVLLAASRSTDRVETSIELAGSQVTANTGQASSHSATETVFYADINQLFLLGNVQKKMRIGLGLALDGMNVSRRVPDLINARRFTDFGTSVDGVVAARFRSNPEGAGWVLSDQLKGSVIGISSYSSYSQQYQTGNTGSNSKNGSLSHLEFGGPDRWLRIINTFAIGKQFTHQTSGGIRYRWDFYRLTATETSRRAAHQFFLYYEMSF